MIKKKLSQIAIILLTIVLFIGNSMMTITAADVDASMIFDGSKISDPIPTNEMGLFVNSKGLMPGDASTQTLQLTNNSNKVIDVYLRAIVPDEEPADTTATTIIEPKDEPVLKAVNDAVADAASVTNSNILSELSLKISVNAQIDDPVRYEGPLSGLRTDGGKSMTDSDGILLGRLSPTGMADVKIDITVPNLDNRYALQEASVIWAFTCNVEEPEVTVTTPGGKNDDDDDNNVVTTVITEDIDDDSVPLDSGSTVTTTPAPEDVTDYVVPLIDAPGTGGIPKTGDESNYYTLAVILFASLTCILFLLLKKKSSKNK